MVIQIYTYPTPPDLIMGHNNVLLQVFCHNILSEQIAKEKKNEVGTVSV